MTRAAGFALYSAPNFAASPASTAAFHCSTGANVAAAGGAFFAACCPLAASAAESTAKVTIKIAEIRRNVLPPRPCLFFKTQMLKLQLHGTNKLLQKLFSCPSLHPCHPLK